MHGGLSRILTVHQFFGAGSKKRNSRVSDKTFSKAYESSMARFKARVGERVISTSDTLSMPRYKELDFRPNFTRAMTSKINLLDTGATLVGYGSQFCRSTGLSASPIRSDLNNARILLKGHSW